MLDGRRMILFDISGLICTPFSARGNMLLWLDPNALPSLVYVDTMVGGLEIDLGIMECTTRLDTEAIASRIPGHVKLQGLNWCTSQLGLPMRRPRMYSLLTNMHTMETRIDYNEQNFGKAMFREAICKAGIYFRANHADIMKEMNRLAANRGIPAHGTGQMYRCRNVLPIETVRRLEVFEGQWLHQRQCKQMSEPETLPKQEWYFADIEQNMQHTAKASTVCPTLVRNSLIWSEQHQRLAVPREHLGMHGAAGIFGRATHLRKMPSQISLH